MDTHFTPLDVTKLEKKIKQEPKHEGFDDIFNTILLLLATLTVFTAAIVFFLLIQKQILIFIQIQYNTIMIFMLLVV